MSKTDVNVKCAAKHDKREQLANETWTTRDEIAYLRGIGEWCDDKDAVTMSAARVIDRKIRFLRGYIANIGKRTWEGMDQFAVETAAKRLLDNLIFGGAEHGKAVTA